MTEPSDPYKLAQYEAMLRRQEQQWRAQTEDIQRSDRAAVDLGIATLKTGVLINAGALVAMLAFTGQHWTEQPALTAEILRRSESFVWGLISVALGGGVSYFYQSIVTTWHQHKLNEASSGKKPKYRTHVRVAAITLAALMIGLVIGGYVEFVHGVIAVMRALHP